MCVIETTGAREYKVRMKSSLFVTRIRLFCLSVSRSLFATNARWIIIFHRGRLAVVSLDHLFLIIIFWMTMLFLTPRFEKTHRNASLRKNEDACLSLCLSVCLSLSRARASWQRRARAIIAQKKGRTKKRLLSRRLTAAQKKAKSHQIRALSFETTRKEEEEDARERVLSLLRAVLRVKEIERCDFWFLPFVFVRLCLRVVSGERERERVR